MIFLCRAAVSSLSASTSSAARMPLKSAESYLITLIETGRIGLFAPYCHSDILRKKSSFSGKSSDSDVILDAGPQPIPFCRPNSQEKACDSRSGIVRPSATMGTGERFLPALRTGAIQNPSILLHLGLQVFRDKTKKGMVCTSFWHLFFPHCLSI